MTAIYRQDLTSLVYCSHATELMTATQAPSIIKSAQKRNPQMEITGVLTYGGGMFLQWLEGPHHFVQELMERIRKDPRHDCILQLHAMSGLQARLYPDWSMELVPSTDIQAVLKHLIEKTQNARHALAITMMLQLFDDGPLKGLVDNQH